MFPGDPEQKPWENEAPSPLGGTHAAFQAFRTFWHLPLSPAEVGEGVGWVPHVGGSLQLFQCFVRVKSEGPRVTYLRSTSKQEAVLLATCIN